MPCRRSARRLAMLSCRRRSSAEQRPDGPPACRKPGLAYGSAGTASIRQVQLDGVLYTQSALKLFVGLHLVFRANDVAIVLEALGRHNPERQRDDQTDRRNVVCGRN